MKLADFKTFAEGDSVTIPLVASTVRAGFPSPADDYLEGTIDFNRYLVRHPAATFAVRAEGNSMEKVGIFSGDLLIVDKALDAKDGSIVVAEVEGAFTVKRLRIIQGRAWLYPENERYEPILVTDVDSQVWGVVTHCIHVPK